MNRKVINTFATIAAFAGGLPSFGKEYPKLQSFERLEMKGAAGVYDRTKHLSRAQRKRGRK